eukprot:354564-Chlamydomonas_euryale.AAC.3
MCGQGYAIVKQGAASEQGTGTCRKAHAIMPSWGSNRHAIRKSPCMCDARAYKCDTRACMCAQRVRMHGCATCVHACACIVRARMHVRCECMHVRAACGACKAYKHGTGRNRACDGRHERMRRPLCAHATAGKRLLMRPACADASCKCGQPPENVCCPRHAVLQRRTTGACQPAQHQHAMWQRRKI